VFFSSSGFYGGTCGPAYETPAEVKSFSTLGLPLSVFFFASLYLKTLG
jgi:hypothetical protein